MFENLYEWIRSIAFYMVITTAAVQMLPEDSYKKYIRFFIGIVLILLMMEPVLKVFTMEESLNTLYKNETYRQQIEEIKKSSQYLKETEKTPDEIEVEDIKIEP